MNTRPEDHTIESLVHDVNSKCSSLKSAATLLKTALPKDAEELLRLMAGQAESLVRVVTTFRQNKGPGR